MVQARRVLEANWQKEFAKIGQRRNVLLPEHEHVQTMARTLHIVLEASSWLRTRSNRARTAKGMNKPELRLEIFEVEMEGHGQKIQQEAQTEADKRTSKRQQRIAVYD